MVTCSNSTTIILSNPVNVLKYMKFVWCLQNVRYSAYNITLYKTHVSKDYWNSKFMK